MGQKNPHDGGVYTDCWHIPGGGIEDGENQTAALGREIKEEVGLDIKNHSILLIDDVGTGSSIKTLKDSGETVICAMNFYVYSVDCKEIAENIKVRPGTDLIILAWMPIAHLEKRRLTPPSKLLFKRLGYL